MRFDDSLETVLAADISSTFGVQTAWRQLVDLIGRGRVPATPEAVARLRAIRAQVPPPVRAASARALAFANPPAALVRLFAEDELSIAAPVLRIARLMPHEWVAMLPDMPSANRSILRHRRDLGPTVNRALESYGPSDFVLPPAALTPPPPADADAEPVPVPGVADDVSSAPGLAAPENGEEHGDGGADQGNAQSAEPATAANIDATSQPAPEEAPLSIDWRDVLAARPAVALDTVPAAPAAPAAPQTILPGVAPLPDPRSELEQIAAPPIADVTVDTPVAVTPDVTASPLPDDSTFVSLASVALGLPVVADAIRRAGENPVSPPDAADLPPLPPMSAEPADAAVSAVVAAPITGADADIDAQTEPRGDFKIADIVARIDAFQRDRDQQLGMAPGQTQNQTLGQPSLFNDQIAPPEAFRFETDATGLIRWVQGVSRSALIGVALDGSAQNPGAQVDGVAAGAFRRRAGFANARLLIDGNADAAGQWRITGIPVFDRDTGRFTGYRGTGRRPRADERADPDRDGAAGGRTAGTDAIRQLVHELRTPTTAIAGFAEMIEGEMLGPVPAPYRTYAGSIRHQASGLLGAIDDLDTAARLDSNALDLRPASVVVQPVLSRIIDDLRPLASLRRTAVNLFVEPNLAVYGDERAVERLFGRLLATMVAAGGADETIMVVAAPEGAEMVGITIDRPRALAAYQGDALLSVDADHDADADSGAPLLGTGFALRLVRNLAAELRGSLTIGADRLTLRLPAAFTHGVGHASTL